MLFSSNVAAISTDVQTWFIALFTIMVLSLLIKESALSRISEHLFMGTSVAHIFLTTLFNFLGRMPIYLATWYIYVPIMLIGAMFYVRFVLPEHRWASRFPTAFIVGISTGLMVRVVPEAQILDQVALSIKPIEGSLYTMFTNTVVFVGVFTGLMYFLFYESIANNPIIRGTRRIGRSFLLLSFGAGWGTAIIGDGAKLLERLQFLLYTWLGLR